ncbi:MAG: ABC transporter substrate-binding protein [Oscillospiraceae bacterium]|nr:ABC transporter substrate-binding protein [Oscillospiraceae bacterium]
MKATPRRIITFILVLSMCFCSFAACGGTKGPTAPTLETPLVVAYDPFSAKFSPFFADSAYDQDVVDMTQLQLLTTDRSGGIVYNAIGGQTVKYNGTAYNYKGIADIKVSIDEKKNTTTYRAKIKSGVKFSDGQEFDADDVIFTYYVFLDPSYVGSTTLGSYNIIGLNDYQTQTTSAVYDKYHTIAEKIYAAGKDHKWASSDEWTEEQQTGYWDLIAESWKEDLQGIVNYCVGKYAASYAEGELGFTSDEIIANEKLQIPFGMVMWGFATAEKDSDKKATGKITAGGKTYDLKNNQYPTIDDLYAVAYGAYNGNPEEYWATEQYSGDATDVVGPTYNKFILKFGSKDEAMGGTGVPSISGIKKIDQRTVEVTTNGYEAPAIYSIFGISIAPLHYYGNEALYDYKANKFGHEFGNLDIVKAKTNSPMGAGAYKFVKYENKVVYFEANENYYKGCPKIHYIQFKEVGEADKITALQTGAADVSNPSGSKVKFQAIRDTNSNKELTGDIITTNSVDNLGYGYMGINASTVLVGTDPASDASKNLRRAFATLFAVYRDVSINSYYGDAAAVINYPISNTSWAAPQKSDADYEVAFSKDVDGKPIYTSDMDANAKYEAALNAAVGFLKAAGFTYSESTKTFTAAPAGAKLTYEALVPGDGVGDHPNFQILSNASNALKTIGITLTVNDLTDSTVLWDRIDAGTQEIWTAAWSATIDPDMYQIYHSSGIIGRNGSDSNHYHIDDAKLDEYIVDARKSADQSQRKTIYKACLDIIIDWAVEIPSYQRQNVIIFSTNRVKIDTLTPDITTYWGWMHDIELLEVVETETPVNTAE